MKLKIALLAIFPLMVGVEKEINISFYLKGVHQAETKIYIVDAKRNCFLLGGGDNIVLPDTLTTSDVTLYLESGKHKVVFPVINWKNCKEVVIDFDCRSYKNAVKEKYGLSSFKRSKYYIKETTVDDIMSVSKPRNQYYFPKR